MELLELKVHGDVTIVVPRNLESVTTYVLLEQETWFEKEMIFLGRWLRPGMTVIDIGANLGVYSLPLARLVGPEGRVFAYEPGSEARRYLERSRDINGLTNLDILPFALSDREEDGYLVFGHTTELNALGSGGRGESVRVTSLNVEDRVRRWTSPDFLKIDAEGAEEKIISGARDFLRKHCPLIMFELLVDGRPNVRLRSLFPEIEYQLYRTLPGAPILIPVQPGEALDSCELNLFAAKAERVQSLSSDGFLVQNLSTWEPDNDAQSAVLPKLKCFDFALAFAHLFNETFSLHPDYRASLAAYAFWCDLSRSPSIRCSALHFAFTTLYSLCSRDPSAARLSTLGRIAWDWGKRDVCIQALASIIYPAMRGILKIAEPFLPASQRFDSIGLRGAPEVWFVASAAELYERVMSFSSYFAPTPMTTDWLCNQPYAIPSMERRRLLIAARAGRRPVIPKVLELESKDNLNASVWRTKKVPGVA